MQKPWDSLPYHPVAEEIVDILRQQTQNTRSDLYFRVLTAYFMAQMAASMRCSIVTKDRGKIPVNAYVCALMESGAGKGHSLNVLEDSVVNQFKKIFTKSTFPQLAELAIEAEALDHASRNSTEIQEEIDKLNKEFHGLGAMPYSFSEGTGPAYKQVRIKAQMAGVGSLNYICDEIGSNLLGAQELLTVCLETYDVGKVKEKITKSSSDNIRLEQRSDPVPSNMMVFGTPAKVFNGGREEVEFISLQETGYARRFLFGFGNKGTEVEYSAEELYDLLSSSTTSTALTQLSDKFANLADIANHKLEIIVPRDVGIKLLQYKMDCEAEAELLPEHDHIRKAEMQHRYFKALKLSGAYAFVDSALVLEESHLYAAIKVVEDSGAAFTVIMNRPKPYVRLAKYIAQCEGELTHADLDTNLVFYKGSQSVKNDMLHLATAWGYANNIIIKRRISDSIEFISGESLQDNTLTEMIVSYSTQMADNYKPATPDWLKLHKLTQKKGLHWVNHHMNDNYRLEENAKKGFNMIVIDCDGEVSLDTAKELLKEYTSMYYTTKSHTADVNRFRLILPIKYHIKLNAKDYKEFMANVYKWLPFNSDESTDQRSKKWESHNGQHEYITGSLLDPTIFIPRTSKAEEQNKTVKNIGSADSLQRWFLLNELHDGNRNNGLLKYAMLQYDAGKDYDEAEDAVKTLNQKLGDDKLKANELQSTILKTLADRFGV